MTGTGTLWWCGLTLVDQCNESRLWSPTARRIRTPTKVGTDDLHSSGEKSASRTQFRGSLTREVVPRLMCFFTTEYELNEIRSIYIYNQRLE